MHLIEEPAPGRYRFHDLLRAYAAERALANESAAGRDGARDRTVAWHLHTADTADRILMPLRRHVALDPLPPHCHPLSFTSYEQALAWCDAEQANLVAIVHEAAQTGRDDQAWKLASTLWGFFCLRRPLADWITTERTGLAAAKRTGDPLAQAWALNSLGTAYFCVRWFDKALECFVKALEVRRDIGDLWGEGITLNNLGELYWDLSRLDDALACHQEALALFEAAGNRRGEGITLDNLSVTYRKLGRTADSLACHQQALALFRELGDRRGEGMALNNLADTYRELGRLDDAVGKYRETLKIRRQAGDRQGEAATLHGLGIVLHDTGNLTAARRSWQQALAILRDLGDPAAADLRDEIANLKRQPEYRLRVGGVLVLALGQIRARAFSHR